jgi:hypothetical protein
MDKNGTAEVKKPNEFTFSKTKGFSYGSYCTKTSKVVLEEKVITVNQKSDWFYFIKGKNKTAIVDYGSIDKIEAKVHFSFWDLIFGLAFLLFFIISQEFPWLIATAVWLFCGFGKNIIIRLKNGSRVVIMSEGFGQQGEIDQFLGAVTEKLQTLPIVGNEEKTTESVQELNELSDENFISKLPFRRLVEGNQKIPPKILPFVNQIAAGIIIILLAGLLYGTFGGGSTARLEKRVFASMKEQNIAVNDVKLVKVGKNIYSGTAYCTSWRYGGTKVRKTISVFSDGRNIQWELDD